MRQEKVKYRQHPLDFNLYIFDMGNVVIRNIETLDKIAQHYGFDEAELRQDYNHYAFPLMDGTIDSALYWQHVEHQFGIRVTGDPLAEFFRPVWNEPVVDIITQLRKLGKRVVCGSNTYASHWDYLRAEGFLEIFDGEYASHEMGVSKPSKYFFTRILDTEQVAPINTFFIDDYLENVLAAQALGITAHHYRDDQSLEDYFKNIL